MRLLEMILELFFPPKMGFLDGVKSSQEYHRRMERCECANKQFGALYDGCGALRRWENGRWRVVKEA